MYRFLLRPKWIGFHLLVVVAIVTMINLGLWQLRRLEARQEFNAVVAARYDADPVALDDVLATATLPDTVEWRPVEVTGEYLPAATIRIVNRFQNGSAGDNVVDPLRLPDGRLLLVNRGFLPQAADLAAPPTGPVALVGRLRSSETRGFGALSDPADGVLREAQRVDIDRLDDQLDGDTVAMYIDVISSQPADSELLQPVVKPDLSEGSHRSYAIQWFIFSVCVAVGWVLAVRRSVATTG